MPAAPADASAFPAPAPPPAERPPRPAATIVVVARRRRRHRGAAVAARRARRPQQRRLGVSRRHRRAGDALAHAAVRRPRRRRRRAARLGLASGGLDYYVAAIRECFEESGLLFARADATGARRPRRQRRRRAWRPGAARCIAASTGIAEFCAAEGLRLAADRLVYLSHWLTPLGRAKRFDTRFFIAAAPTAQTAAHDGTELVEQLWIAPKEALARKASLKLLTPTQKTLEPIGRFASVAEAMAWASRAAPGRARRCRASPSGREGLRPVMPDEHRVGRARPHRSGRPRQRVVRLVPDRAVRLSERVIRVTADNGSVMTGPGHQHLPGRRRRRRALGGDRSRARRSTRTSMRSSPPRPGRSTASSSPTRTRTIRRRRWR